MSNEGQGKKMGDIIAKCWADEGFKQKLLADTAGTLKAEGVELPPGQIVKAVENTDTVFHLIIPAKPNSELSDDDLDKVAGGLDMNSAACQKQCSTGDVCLQPLCGPSDTIGLDQFQMMMGPMN